MPGCKECGTPLPMGDKICHECGSEQGDNSKTSGVGEMNVHCPKCGSTGIFCKCPNKSNEEIEEDKKINGFKMVNGEYQWILYQGIEFVPKASHLTQREIKLPEKKNTHDRECYCELCHQDTGWNAYHDKVIELNKEG